MAWMNGAQAHVSARMRRRILQRDQGICQACGAQGGSLEVDHIDNRRGSGYDDETNLQLLCVQCHKRKTQVEATMANARRLARRRLPQRPHPGLV